MMACRQNVPMYITESNIAYSTNESFMDIFGALWLADYMGTFLTNGGGAFYYQYEPLPMYDGCPQQNSWGAFGMLVSACPPSRSVEWGLANSQRRIEGKASVIILP